MLTVKAIFSVITAEQPCLTLHQPDVGKLFQNKKNWLIKMCENLTAFCALSACSLRVSSPMLYRSNDRLNEAQTEWMTRVWGTRALHLLLPHAHPPPVSPTHQPASPRHKTNTYDSQQEKAPRAPLAPFNPLTAVSILGPFVESLPY